MKQHEGEVALSYTEKVLGAVNNWEAQIKQFRVCDGFAIEFLSWDILLRGGYKGQLEFIDYSQTGCSMPSDIRGLHPFSNILDIQLIAKNILVKATKDELKVIDPISTKCYLKFKINDQWYTSAIAYF